MAKLHVADSILLVEYDEWEVTADYEPKGRVGRILSRFYQPQAQVTFKVVSVGIRDGVPSARLIVTKVTG
jgi:asparagine synthetase A